MYRRSLNILGLLALVLLLTAAFQVERADAAVTVRVTSPNGGETWRTGETHNITWTSTDADGYSVFIEFSEEMGTTWHNISGDSGLPNTGTWEWTIPSSYDTTHGRIRVKLVRPPGDVYSDISNSDFTIIQTLARPVNLHSTAASNIGIKLEWEDMSSNEAGFKIERKTGSGSFAQVKTVGANVTNCWDTGLTPGTTYQYRVRAYNSHGNSDYSNVTSAETILYTLAAPQAPVNLAAFVGTGNRIDLTWIDRSSSESGFKIERRFGTGGFSQIATVGANITTYSDPDRPAGSYTYRVRAYNTGGDSDFSNEADAVIFNIMLVTELIPAPTNLTAAAESGSTVSLDWQETASGETGFKIERRTEGGTFDQVGTVGENVTSYTDNGLSPGTTYTYRVRTYKSDNNSAFSNVASATTSTETTSTAGRTVLTFYIDSGEYYVQGPSDSSPVLHTMDTTPVIRESRTMLPIRYVAEPLGASVEWDGAARRATVELDSTRVELIIENSTAVINGSSTPIDPANPAVVPFIMPPGRTMLPLRFIAENLGCQVDWDPTTREVKITYPKP